MACGKPHLRAVAVVQYKPVILPTLKSMDCEWKAKTKAGLGSQTVLVSQGLGLKRRLSG